MAQVKIPLQPVAMRQFPATMPPQVAQKEFVLSAMTLAAGPNAMSKLPYQTWAAYNRYEPAAQLRVQTMNNE